MVNLEKLETAVGKNIEQWNVEDLDEIIKNEENFLLFKDPEFLSECLKHKLNKEVTDILTIVKISDEIEKSVVSCNNLLNLEQTKKIDSDEFIGKLEESINKSESLYDRMISYLVLLSTVDNFDITKYELNIMNDSLEIVNIISGLSNLDSIDSTYNVIMKLFEILFPLRSRYFEKTSKDVLDKNTLENLSKILDDIHTYEIKLMDLFNNKGENNE